MPDWGEIAASPGLGFLAPLHSNLFLYLSIRRTGNGERKRMIGDTGEVGGRAAYVDVGGWCKMGWGWEKEMGRRDGDGAENLKGAWAEQKESGCKMGCEEGGGVGWGRVRSRRQSHHAIPSQPPVTLRNTNRASGISAWISTSISGGTPARHVNKDKDAFTHVRKYAYMCV